MQSDIKRTVEALLFASPVPLSVNKLKAIISGSDARGIRQTLTELQGDYDRGEHSFQLKEIAGGWRVVTRQEHARVIEEMLKGQRSVRLSKAALEVLALVSYRQPCTRLEVDDVRGVNSGGSIATLAARGLIRIVGRAESLGRPLLYGTTDEFLSHLGINSIEDLPRLTEIEALLAASEERSAEESPQIAQERRLKLVEGMENISEVIREQTPEEQEIVPIQTVAPPEMESAVDIDEPRRIEATIESEESPPTENVDPELEECPVQADDEPRNQEEHSRVLQEGLEEERLHLTVASEDEVDIGSDPESPEEVEITVAADDPESPELVKVAVSGKADGA